MHFWIWQTLMRCTCFSLHPNQLKHSRLKLHDVRLFILLLFSGKTETQAILGHFRSFPLPPQPKHAKQKDIQKPHK